jgi:predicted YcjX-like family ATPase
METNKNIFNDSLTIVRIFFLQLFPKTIIDRMFMKISRKIAVIGTARSGKTVFLTSLINHLEEHNKMEFLIKTKNGKYAQVSDFKSKSVSKYIGAKFNYKKYRNALVDQGHWPTKTTDTSHFICDYKRSDWKYNRNELHLFDMPGERFADVAIAQYKDFGQWSDYMAPRCFKWVA